VPAGFRSSEREAGRRLLLLVLTLLAGVALSAALAEAMLRLNRPQAVGVSRLPLVYDPDPALGYRYRPGATGRLQRLFEIDRVVRINALGFHDVERDPAFAGPLVLAIGDSFTASLHFPPDSSWTRRLEAKLCLRLDPRLEVWNLGLDGTGSDVHLALLREQLARRVPRAVVLAFYANDVVDVARGPIAREVRAGYVLQPRDATQARAMRELADRMDRRRSARWLFEHVYLARLAVYLRAGDRNLFRTNVVGPSHLGEAPPPLDAAAAHDRLRAIFRELAALARAHGFALFVVAVPDRDRPEATLEALRPHVGELGARLVDPLPVLRDGLERTGRAWQDLYWARDGHFTALGNELFGDAVADALAPTLGRADPPVPGIPALPLTGHGRARGAPAAF
jgi:lysophospholipase L1-like esterase